MCDVRVVLVLLLCIIAYYFKGMYESVCFILPYITAILISLCNIVLHYVRPLESIYCAMQIPF